MRSTIVAMLVSFLSSIFVPAPGRSPEPGEGGMGARQTDAGRRHGWLFP
jgi:hypothetical protein